MPLREILFILITSWPTEYIFHLGAVTCWEAAQRLLYLLDKGRAVYMHAYQPGQSAAQRLVSACGEEYRDLGHGWYESSLL